MNAQSELHKAMAMMMVVAAGLYVCVCVYVVYSR